MKYKSISTGSTETEEQLQVFALNAKTLNDGIKKRLFVDEYLWQVMTIGRARPGDSREGSTAPDDTGGYFVLRDGLVYLTEKAKACIHL